MRNALNRTEPRAATAHTHTHTPRETETYIVIGERERGSLGAIWKITVTASRN